jgi:hypothetical protein
MLGESPTEIELTTRGTIGDRAWALREVATGRIATAKKFSKLLDFRAVYDSAPAAGRTATITITLPDGRKIHPEDAGASETISDALGAKIKLERVDNLGAELAGIDPKTIFGDVPIEDAIPGLTSATMPDHFPLAKGTFYDTDVMHVIATGTLRHMEKIAPKSKFDHRRFRATIVLDSGAGADRFVEDEWLGGVLAVGSGAKITNLQPALRCVMTTHPQQGLERDMDVLRSVARNHNVKLGVFAGIERGGRVRVGDPVWLER